MAADDDDVGAAGEAGVVDDAHAGVRDVVDERLRADHVGRAAAVALREPELQRAADAQDLVERGLEAEPPELAHEPLGGLADVVGKEQHGLAGLAERRDGVDGAFKGVVADPYAAVEVEQKMVIGTNPGRERHSRALSLPAVIRLLALLIACLALIASGCGGDDEPEREAAATEAPAATEAATEEAAPTANEIPPGGLRERREAGAQGGSRRSTLRRRSSTSPRPTSRRSPRRAATSRSRSTPRTRRSPAVRSSTSRTRSSSTARPSTASSPAS